MESSPAVAADETPAAAADEAPAASADEAPAATADAVPAAAAAAVVVEETVAASPASADRSVDEAPTTSKDVDDDDSATVKSEGAPSIPFLCLGQRLDDIIGLGETRSELKFYQTFSTFFLKIVHSYFLWAQLIDKRSILMRTSPIHL